eukprot:CAMPEP_0115835732 /NCGR_PEP_ID=MMETSP0287-20121206/4345_1 /TAXON_ID=412157 /ORGANISM="Chrysochromulina rotalis, Strain UIO044" /LENGTH=130 /DNA_ID=CAMNT_0003289197 /DNA_START=531 /DNA_END=924 /DNA_ORIENTATION=+
MRLGPCRRAERTGLGFPLRRDGKRGLGGPETFRGELTEVEALRTTCASGSSFSTPAARSAITLAGLSSSESDEAGAGVRRGHILLAMGSFASSSPITSPWIPRRCLAEDSGIHSALVLLAGALGVAGGEL